MVLSMNRWSGKVAIVTGASAGIGAALAERLVEEGLLVIITSLFKNKSKIVIIRLQALPAVRKSLKL